MEVPAKVGSLDLMDAVIAGGAKVAGEKALSRFIGNGTVKSGAVKFGIALALSHFGKDNKFVKAAAVGVGIDAVEDVLHALLGGAVSPQSGMDVI